MKRDHEANEELVLPRKRFKASNPDGLVLSPEQAGAVEAIVSGKTESAFITGKAGTGKSVVLRALISQLPHEGLFVTASTGMAASELGGCTVHAFAGLGLAQDPADVIVEKIKKKEAGDRIMAAKILILDEASMISGPLFDLLDVVMQSVRNSSDPFGGCRIILAGDMGQLPPVNKVRGTSIPLIFESKAWKNLRPTIVYLQKSHRQAEDLAFAQMLDELRLGQCTAKTQGQLEAVIGKIHPPDARPVYIFPRNDDVDRLNQKKLQALEGPVYTFKGKDYEAKGYSGGGGTIPSPSRLRDCPFPATLKLKLGAQVMLRKNLDLEAGLFNGAVGTVKAFDDATGYPLIDFAPGQQREPVVIKPQTWELRMGFTSNLIASRVQLPLILAWAISSHKSQGMTIDVPVIADPGSAFEVGQVYVILSRVRRFEQLSFRSFNASTIRADPRIIHFYKELDRDVCEQ